MPAVDAKAVVLEVDPLGSHFVMSAAAVGALGDGVQQLPHATRSDDRGAWHAPAIPSVAAALRGLLEARKQMVLSPRAYALLASVEQLPTEAGAVAHMCEHRPGVRGVVIACAADSAIRQVMSAVPGHRYDAKLNRWWIPAREESLRVLRDQLASEQRIAATREVQETLERVERQLSLSPQAVADLEHRCVVGIQQAPPENPRMRLCRSCSPDLGPVLRSLGLQVTPSLDSWWVTIDGAADGAIRQLLTDQPQLAAGHEIMASLDEATRLARALESMERLSASADGATSLAGVSGQLRPFQGAAVSYAQLARRTFLADEPGLGKTVQALATLEAEGAFPALVVCPAVLRLNWLREAGRWLPSRSAATLDGNAEAISSEIAIVSYDILYRLVEGIEAHPPRALVLDESHFCKNPSARRTEAAQAIATALDPDALVLLLTGTPIVNRPAELASQLRILDRLDAVGGARTLGRVYGEGRELNVLNRRLRRTCFVRRRKVDVLEQLPPKQRVVVPVELSNPHEYSSVQTDIARWARAEAEADARFLSSVEEMEQEEREAAVRARGNEAAQRARRAEALVRLGKLSMVAARGKLDAAIEWIAAFVEADEKLVVFCRHREIGERLLGAFPAAAQATGGISPDRRIEEVERFQTDPECRLIVCSLDAAGVGVTLTAASNVAFVEMGWSPAVHDQAEDRVHRIGQASAVTAWYLLASDTIDERIAAVVERKRQLVSAASDGGAVTDDGVLNEILSWVSREAHIC